jgi:hypothetical protein
MARVASGADLDEHPVRAVAHHQVDLAAAEAHVARHRHQTVIAEEGLGARLGVEALALARRDHRRLRAW